MPRKPPKFHPLNQSPLYRLQSRTKLASYFGLDWAALSAILKAPQPYRERIKNTERNGKSKIRLIQEPLGERKKIHEKVASTLSKIAPPAYLYCPVKGRSYADNAARHLNAKEVRTLDVKEYFPSTPSRRVFWFFHKVMLCSPDVSSVLAQLLTVNGHLATGSAVSPILSFYAFSDMWAAIDKIVQKFGCVLSVYMDDVTISGDAVPERLIWQVRQKIHGAQLIYHKEKRYSAGTAEITGVLIKTGRSYVPNRQLKKAYEARQELAMHKGAEQEAVLKAKLSGLAAQQRQVEKAAEQQAQRAAGCQLGAPVSRLG